MLDYQAQLNRIGNLMAAVKEFDEEHPAGNSKNRFLLLGHKQMHEYQVTAEMSVNSYIIVPVNLYDYFMVVECNPLPEEDLPF